MTAPSVDPIEFLFDENIDGWRLDPWDGAVGSVTHAVYNDDGNSLNVLKVDFSWKADKTDPYLAADLMEEIDLGLYSKMVVKVKVESDVFGIKVKPFVKVTSNWTSKDSGEKSLDEDGFSTVIFDLSGIEDLQTTKAIGIQFVTPNGTTGNAAAYIDEVKFLP
ncbi:hypothetical protein D3C78_1431820 [compost metagenome]